jgi:hypothetical protein
MSITSRALNLARWFRRLFSSPPDIYHRQRLEHHLDPPAEPGEDTQ